MLLFSLVGFGWPIGLFLPGLTLRVRCILLRYHHRGIATAVIFIMLLASVLVCSCAVAPIPDRLVSEQQVEGGDEDDVADDCTKRAEVGDVYDEMASVLVPRVIPRNSRGEQFRYALSAVDLSVLVLAPRQTGRLALERSQVRLEAMLEPVRSPLHVPRAYLFLRTRGSHIPV